MFLIMPVVIIALIALLFAALSKRVRLAVRTFALLLVAAFLICALLASQSFVLLDEGWQKFTHYVTVNEGRSVFLQLDFSSEVMAYDTDVVDEEILEKLVEAANRTRFKYSYSSVFESEDLAFRGMTVDLYFGGEDIRTITLWVNGQLEPLGLSAQVRKDGKDIFLTSVSSDSFEAFNDIFKKLFK